jgi:hypothetical protein
MAAITATRHLARTYRIRKASAATGPASSQTDWFETPHWAKMAIVTVQLTAAAGTTPICLANLIQTDPVTADDGVTSQVGGFTATSGMTTTGDRQTLVVGPGVTGIANATAAVGHADNWCFINTVLPKLMGLVMLNDHTTGDERYTYTATVEYR